MVALNFKKPPIIGQRNSPALSDTTANEQKHISTSTSAAYNPPSCFPLSPTPTKVLCFKCGLALEDIQLIHIHLVIDHHLCNVCGFVAGFETYEELQNHLEQDHFYCETCEWLAPSHQGLQQHNIHKHNMCVTCGEYLEGPNQLKGHRNCHLPLSISCFLCEKGFATLSSVFNHLESGKCEAEATTNDIQRLMSDYYSAYHFKTNIHIPVDKWIYCRACDKSYHNLSELLQHLEFRRCSETYNQDLAQLVDYVKENIKTTISKRCQQSMLPPRPVHYRILELRRNR